MAPTLGPPGPSLAPSFYLLNMYLLPQGTETTPCPPHPPATISISPYLGSPALVCKWVHTRVHNSQALQIHPSGTPNSPGVGEDNQMSLHSRGGGTLPVHRPKVCLGATAPVLRGNLPSPSPSLVAGATSCPCWSRNSGQTQCPPGTAQRACPEAQRSALLGGVGWGRVSPQRYSRDGAQMWPPVHRAPVTFQD